MVPTTMTPAPTQGMPSAWSLLPGNAQERHNFDYFYSVTVADLSGCFDTEFWSGQMLKISHTYPALWHAMNALACIHREYLTEGSAIVAPKPSDPPRIQFALKQFNHAIRSLRDLLSGSCPTLVDQLVVLTTCVLFTCLCSLQGHQVQAFVHINNGIKLLHQWKLDSFMRNPNSEFNNAVEMLLVMFTRLDSQVRPYLSTHQALLAWTDAEIDRPILHRPFQSLLEAEVCLETIFNGMMRLVMHKDYAAPEPTAEILERKRACLQKFAEWDRRISAYLMEEGPLKALDGLFVRRKFAAVFLAADMTKGELAHDELLYQFMELVNICDRILERSGTTPSSIPFPSFRLATSVIEPLYWVGAKCREPTVRREAVRLLTQFPRREGICETIVGVQAVNRIIELEEGCCPTACNAPSKKDVCTTGRWVCGKHRIVSAEFTLVGEREVCVVLKTMDDHVLSRPGVSFVSSWW